MFFLTGVARYLFVPLAEAVVFAMLASYVLSRTLVPTMAKYLLQARTSRTPMRPHARRNLFVRIQAAFEAASSGCAPAIAALLAALPRAAASASSLVFLGACLRRSLVLVPWLGEDFFPAVDAGQFKLHLRARPARASRRPRASATRSRSAIREIIGANELADDHRQHRPAVQRPQPVVQQLGARSGPPTPTSWSR